VTPSRGDSLMKVKNAAEFYKWYWTNDHWQRERESASGDDD